MSTNYNTKIPIVFSSTSIKNFSKNINFNKIKLILESHNKTFHKRSHSTYQNIMTSKNSQNSATNITATLNKYNTNTNRSKENMNIFENGYKAYKALYPFFTLSQNLYMVESL